MNIYKAVIQSGPLCEIKYYKSFRQRGLKHIARSVKQALSSVKQAERNQISGQQNTQRLILCNFKKGDWWVRFSAPYQNFTEEEFEKEVANFFRRVKYHAKKKGLDFKYIGFSECGKRGGNWHLHIVIENSIIETAMKCWKWENGINLTPLYLDGNFKDLAKYVRKDVVGTKRLKTSRNLTKPTVDISRAKKEYKKVERTGCPVEIPQGYYQLTDDTQILVNDFTGAVYSFAFMQLTAQQTNQRRQNIDVWRD
jgi:hypothetical protein